MSIVAAVLAQLIHLGLMLAAAPLAIGLRQRTEALLAGRRGPDLVQPWRDLRRLLRKQPVRAENASPLSRHTPTACLAAATVAVALVPSFTLGMAFAPLSDLLVVFGLLAFCRIAPALAALEPGTAPAALAAARTAMFGCLADPALLLVILALGLLAGTTNLDLLIGLQRQGMLQPLAAAVLAGATLAGLALLQPDAADLTAEFSGADLAVVRFAEALRQLAWLNLLGALLLPFGIAAVTGGLLAWGIGIVAWAVRLVVLAAGVAALRCVVGDLSPARRLPALGIAAILGLLAALLVLASAVAA